MFKYLIVILFVVLGYGVKTIYDLKFEVSSLQLKNEKLVTNNKSLNDKNRKNKKRIKNHRKALHTKNMARIKNKIVSAPAKSIPLLGAAVVASATANDIYNLCQDIKEFEELEKSMFGPLDYDEIQNEDEVCGFDFNETIHLVETLVSNVSK